MKREHSLISSTIVLFIGSALPSVALFLITPILTENLTREEYGSFDLIHVLTSLLIPAVLLQIQTAVFRFLIEERDSKAEMKETVSTVFAFALPVSLLTVSLVSVFLRFGDWQIKLMIGIYLFMYTMVLVVGQVARGLGRTREYAASSVHSSLILLVLVFLFVKTWPMGLKGVLFAYTSSSVIATAILFLRVRVYSCLNVSSVSLPKLRQLLKYSCPMVPNGMAMWVMRMSDRAVISLFMGVEWNGVYAAAAKIPSMVDLVQGAFSNAWQENASMVLNDDDVGTYYSGIFKNFFHLVAGMTSLLLAAVPILFSLLIRGNYQDSYVHIPILVVAEFFYCLATFFGGIYIAYKKTRSVGITTVAAAACNIVIDLVLIRRVGLYAASLSTLISFALLFAYRLIDVQKIIRISVRLPYMLLVMAVLAVQAVFCMQQSMALNIVNIAVGIAVFTWLNAGLIRESVSQLRAFLKR